MNIPSYTPSSIIEAFCGEQRTEDLLKWSENQSPDALLKVVKGCLTHPNFVFLSTPAFGTFAQVFQHTTSLLPKQQEMELFQLTLDRDFTLYTKMVFFSMYHRRSENLKKAVETLFGSDDKDLKANIQRALLFKLMNAEEHTAEKIRHMHDSCPQDTQQNWICELCSHTLQSMSPMPVWWDELLSYRTPDLVALSLEKALMHNLRPNPHIMLSWVEGFENEEVVSVLEAWVNRLKEKDAPVAHKGEELYAQVLKKHLAQYIHPPLVSSTLKKKI